MDTMHIFIDLLVRKFTVMFAHPLKIFTTINPLNKDMYMMLKQMYCMIRTSKND